jgi:hypothetical protein
MAARKQNTPKPLGPVGTGASPCAQAIGGSAWAEVTLWEACDPALFTRQSGIRLLANEGNIHFQLHIVGDRSAFYRVLATCRWKRLFVERN